MPAQSLKLDLLRVVAAAIILFALMFGSGSLLLLQWTWGICLILVAGGGFLWLRSLNEFARRARVA